MVTSRRGPGEVGPRAHGFSQTRRASSGHALFMASAVSIWFRAPVFFFFFSVLEFEHIFFNLFAFD